MGVDFEANFGIGAEIDNKCLNEKNNFDNIEEYLDSILSNTPYVWFSYGEGSYTGESDFYIIALKNPFKNGYDITTEVNKLLCFLVEHKIKHSKIDVVGGLLIF